MPKVLGNSHEMPCQTEGMLLCGHDIPVRNSRGILTKTTNSITFSRYFTIHDTIMPKKMQASMYGSSMAANVHPVANCGKWNSRGTPAANQVPITMNIIK